MLTALLTLAHGSAMVAFTARFYYPPGDRRISLFQVYVCDLDGRRRRQVTHEAGGCRDVRWVDSRRISFVTKQGPVEMDLRTKRRKVLMRNPAEDAVGAARDRVQLTRRGDPAFSRNQDQWFAVTGWNLHTVSDPTVRMAHLPTSVGSYRFEMKLNSDWQIILRHGASRTELEPQSVGISEGLFNAWAEPKGVFYVVSTAFSSTGDVYHLYLLEGERPKPLFDGVDIEEVLGKRWMACAEARDLAPYGKDKAVWTARALLRDKRTGRTVLVADGLAWASSISVNPSAP